MESSASMDLPEAKDLPKTSVEQEAATQSTANAFVRNIVLVGISGSGKSTVGKHLSMLLGFGHLDLDTFIERSSGKSITRIFSDEGEEGFRSREASALDKITHIRAHVVSLGAGALQNEISLATARKIGPIVWLKPSAEEVARRLVMKPDELKKRPFFSEFAAIEPRDQRQKLIRERIAQMTDARSSMYQQADIVLDGGFVTPETSACQLKDILSSMGLVPEGHKDFGRWHESYG